MSALRRLSPPPPVPPRSPERDRLAEAIQGLTDALASADRVSAAQQRLDDRLFDQLEPAASAAKKALDEAREEAPAMLVDDLLSGETASGGDVVARAEVALREANAAVEQARQARRLLRDEAERAQIAIGAARQKLDAAVGAVVEADPAKQAVVVEFFRAGRQLLRLARVMMTLKINVSRGVEAVDLGLVLRIGDIARPGSGGNASLFTPDPDWAMAIAALKVDADAPLPNLPPTEDDPAGNAGARAA